MPRPTESLNTLIQVPSSFTVTSAIQLAHSIGAVSSDAVTVDFARAKWIDPSAALIASRAIAMARARRPVNLQQYQHLGYWAHIGFFQACGESFGLPVGRHGGATYVPIAIHNVEAFRAAARQNQSVMGDFLQKEAERLAEVLIRTRCQESRDAMTMCIREMFRNVAEHSRATNLGYAAQYWSNSGVVEFAVLDTGVGILETLCPGLQIPINTHEDAILLSMMPGVSRALGTGRTAKNGFDQTWSNAGYGLYLTSRLCRDNGSFAICTGTAGMLLSGEANARISWGLDGTFVRMRIEVSKMTNFLKQMGFYRKTAAELIQRVGRAGVRKVEVASKLVRENFA